MIEMIDTALPERQIRGNPLESQLRTFATCLMDSGYGKKTIQDKLYLLAALGWWLGRRQRVISRLDEGLIGALPNRSGEFTLLICQLCASSLITCENVTSSLIASWLLINHL